MKDRILKFVTRLLPSSPIYAHCDVPCGIYDPRPAQIAAETVLRMTQILLELDKSGKTVNEKNNFIRAVWTKEEHARKCKEEILVLWTDYFKPEHLEKYPQLHDTFWKAAKLCSKTKQEVSLENAQALGKAVDEIAAIFHETHQH